MPEHITDNLTEHFIRAAEEAAATVEKVKRDAVALNDCLLAATSDDELVLFAQPDDLDEQLFLKFRSNAKIIVNPTNEQLKTIKTGITGAFCAVASTGSVCVAITKNLSSPISMLTRKHIVIVDVNTIVPMPRDVFSEEYAGGKGLKRSFSFITGPSATADMGPLVRGVHGPGKLHIIIMEQADGKY
jgi:L-lactate dehydrogenase complex protein LldG